MNRTVPKEIFTGLPETGRTYFSYLLLPRRLNGDSASLRSFRLRDLPSLRLQFESLFPGFEVNCSLLRFYAWLSSKFPVFYSIRDNRQDILGFIGLYDILPDRTFFLSLAVFNPQNRRKGYGSCGLEILLDHFAKKGLAGPVYAEVVKSNDGALSFFKRRGFEICAEKNEMLVLRKYLRAKGDGPGNERPE